MVSNAVIFFKLIDENDVAPDCERASYTWQAIDNNRVFYPIQMG
jgi:hypothetical protein